jgi:monovalent cation:H+ antiporter-2, CPA2 family
MGQEILRDLAILLAASFPILFIARRIGFPEVFAFLLTGIVIGPHGLKVLREVHQIEAIAEIGVALILFFIGLHFPINRLKSLGKITFVGGTLQMSFTIATFVGLGMLALSLDARQALFYAFLVTFGSTAVILPLITSRGEMGSSYANRFLGASLFQDFAVIPMLLIVPALAVTEGGDTIPRMIKSLVIAGLVIAAFVIIARTFVTRMLARIYRLGSNESLTAASVVIVIGTIALAREFGISPALGAFAAGIVIGETEHIHEVSRVLRPFHDLLASLFFASIGMLFNPRFVLEHPLEVAVVVAVVLLVKPMAAFPAFRATGAASRASLRAAVAITPVGEFSFLLAQEGKRFGLLDTQTEQVFLSVALLTLAASPWIVAGGVRLGSKLAGGGESAPPEPMSGHVIVVGYGLNGRNVTRALRAMSIKQLVIEENQDRFEAAREDATRAMLADAADAEVLRSAGVERCVALVVAIASRDESRVIVRQARQLNPTMKIIVRTRLISEVESLRALGADEIIPEEFETSIEIVMRLLRTFHVPGNILATQLRVLRDEGYRLLRDPDARAIEADRLTAIVGAGTFDTFQVLPESFALGKTVAELDLSRSTGVRIPLLIRDGAPLVPSPEILLGAGDVVVLVGPHEFLTRAMVRLERGETGEDA